MQQQEQLVDPRVEKLKNLIDLNLSLLQKKNFRALYMQKSELGWVPKPHLDFAEDTKKANESEGVTVDFGPTMRSSTNLKTLQMKQGLEDYPLGRPRAELRKETLRTSHRSVLNESSSSVLARPEERRKLAIFIGGKRLS